MTMKYNYLFYIKCYDGNYGWGRTNQHGYIIVDSKTLIDAEIEVKKTLPGGWEYYFVKITNDEPGLCTDMEKIL